MLRGSIVRIAAIAAGLLLGLLSVSWFVGSLIVGGDASQVMPAPAPAREVRLPASDGIELAGTYWPGKAANSPGVVLLHGLGASRNQTAANAAWLASRGYGVLSIDLRGHGASTITDHSYGLSESLDARAAFDWLKTQQRGAKIGIIGVSLGGAAALLGRDGPVPADALVLQGVFPTIRAAIWHRMRARTSVIGAVVAEPLLSFQSLPRYGVWPSQIAPIKAVRSYRGPVLVIGSEKDPYTPPDETRALYAAVPGPKSLWLVPGLDHARLSLLDSPEWQARVGDFLGRTIGKP